MTDTLPRRRLRHLRRHLLASSASPKTDYLRGLNAVAGDADFRVRGKKVQLGWNCCVDLVVNGTELMEALFPGGGPPAERRDHEKLGGLEDLRSAFAHFFENGAAGERLFATQKVFDKVVAAAKTLKRQEYHCGGNAALIATALAELGADVLLGGPVGADLQRLLHPAVGTVASGGGGGGADAVHLILEYAAGDTWGELRAPRANRFIVVFDEANARIAGLEPMDRRRASEAPPDAFVASGLNQLELLGTAERTARLAAVRTSLLAVPPAPVHLELASFADKAFLRTVLEELLPCSDSFGLNEQELADCYEALGGRYDQGFARDHLVRRVPEPKAVASAIAFMIRASGDRVSRVHFHCLPFHIIAQSSGSSVWATPRAAVARGALAATLVASKSALPALGEDDIDLLAPTSFDIGSGGGGGQISSSSPVASWRQAVGANGTFEFHLAPVLVCRKPKRTVGLGDNCSANGLAFSLK